MLDICLIQFGIYTLKAGAVEPLREYINPANDVPINDQGFRVLVQHLDLSEHFRVGHCMNLQIFCIAASIVVIVTGVTYRAAPSVVPSSLWLYYTLESNVCLLT